jgi:rhamnosyltransferase
MPKLSIIIPTLNPGPDFAKTLHALTTQQTTHDTELLIIDSTSTDQTLQLAKQANAKTLLIPRKNFNHAQTRNQAIAQSTGDILILLSQDALPANPHLLENLARNFTDPTVAAVYARHQPYPHHPKHIQQAVQEHNGSLTRTESTLTSDQYEKLTPLQRFQTCKFDNVCSAIRRTVWQEIPFPETNFAEDLAWSKAVLLAEGRGGGGQHKIIYDPTALVTHSHHLPLRQLYTRTRQTHRALKQLFNLHLLPHAHQLPRNLITHLRTTRNLPHSLITILATYRA